jgi:hypothetical protein
VDLTELATLKRQLDALHTAHLAALSQFVFPSDHGFSRILNENRTAISEVSTATAVLSIVRAHDWNADWQKLIQASSAWQRAERENGPLAPDAMSPQNVMERLLRDDAWTSESLSDGDRNPYHVAFTTEAALALHETLGSCPDDNGNSTQVHAKFKEAASYLAVRLLLTDPETDKTAAEREATHDGESNNAAMANRQVQPAVRIRIDPDSRSGLIEALTAHSAVDQVQQLDEGHLKVHLIADADTKTFASELPGLLVAASSALLGLTWGGEPSQVPQEAGSISIQFPPSAHLTQVVVRTLIKLDAHLALTESGEQGTLYAPIQDAVTNWAWKQILLQLALVQAKSPEADAYELAYALWCFSAFGIDDLAPDERKVIWTGLDRVLSMQRKDGLWPRSHPIFHHKNIGAAYSYEFEMLAELLRRPEFEPHLIANLDRLAKLTGALTTSAYNVDGVDCWSSGHIPKQQRPESWATAAVYLFAYELSRLLAEAIRRRLFEHVGAEYRVPAAPVEPAANEQRSIGEAIFDLLDSELPTETATRSLLETIHIGVVEPIKNSREAISRGRPLDRDVPTSILLFGPPGTAKSDIAEKLGPAVGWPVVKVDPSHLVTGGIDRIQTEANAVFELVALSEGVVVFFDEFDELMRSRSTAGSEMLSRFLTTAMLPKLADIRRRRRVLLVVATNHLDDLDPAVKRVGRFDLVIPVLAPSRAAKEQEWQGTIREAYGKIGRRQQAMLDLLNHGETKTLHKILEGQGSPEDWTHSQLEDRIEAAWKSSSAYVYLQDKAKNHTEYKDTGDDPEKLRELLVGPLCEGRRLPVI